MTILPYSINKREAWNAFVEESKQGTFLLDRNFMDYHADRFFDCSLLVYSDEVDEADNNNDSLMALFPANWNAEEKTVYSHQGLTYGGLITRTKITQTEVLQISETVNAVGSSLLPAPIEEMILTPHVFAFSISKSFEETVSIASTI